MKKLISTGLSVAMAMSVCSTKTYAWAPTDFDDPKCIDVRKLGVDTDYITKNKVCGCKTCSVDAVMYNRLDDYLTDLENRIESISKEENYIETITKLNNIDLILNDVINSIKNNRYKKSNFFLVSANYDPNQPTAIAQFAKKDGITYKNDYDDTYFTEISDKAKIILNKVQKHIKLREDSPIKFNYAEDKKDFVTTLVVGLGAVTVTALTVSFDKIKEFFNNKPMENVDKLIETIRKLPEEAQDIIKKKFLDT